MFLCHLVGAGSDWCGENGRWKGPTSRQVKLHFGKSRYNSEKSSHGRVYPAVFGHGRVKVGVDQSAVSVSRCKRVGTLRCRILTRVYPVVLFTLLIFMFRCFTK